MMLEWEWSLHVIIIIIGVYIFHNLGQNKVFVSYHLTTGGSGITTQCYYHQDSGKMLLLGWYSILDVLA